MIPNIDQAVRVRLGNTLTSSHQVKVTVRLTNLVGEATADLSDRLLSGQIDVDTSAEVVRTCSMELVDAAGALQIASNDPDDAGLYMHKMIQVIYSVREHNEDGWIDIPVFHGPVVKADRNGDIVQVEAQGKELMARAPLWNTFTAKKGDPLVNVIERLLVNRAGESPGNLKLGGYKARLNKDYSFTELAQNPWEAAKKLARADDFYLFYDGAGQVRMRKISSNVARKFTAGNEGDVLTEPQITFDSTEAKNAVVVKGGKPKGGKQVESRVVLPLVDPISPFKIGRKPTPTSEIVPRYLVEVIENDQITTQSKADEIAKNRLERLRKSQVTVQFDSVPIPYLEEHDLLRLEYSGYVTDFYAKQFTIPLTVGDSMPIGYNRKIRLSDGKPRVQRSNTKKKRGRK